MEAWFISDIHLKDMKERNGEILLRFLHSLADKDPALAKEVRDSARNEAYAQPGWGFGEAVAEAAQ